MVISHNYNINKGIHQVRKTMSVSQRRQCKVSISVKPKDVHAMLTTTTLVSLSSYQLQCSSSSHELRGCRHDVGWAVYEIVKSLCSCRWASKEDVFRVG